MTKAFIHLKELCQSGLEKNYSPVTEEAQSRLDYELSVIEKAGYADSFLAARDIVLFAKLRGAAAGAGRGSAAGSIVCYTLGITDVDPIRCGLMFERFINPERADIPEINIDIAPNGYQSVVKYAAQRHGAVKPFKINLIGLNELAVIGNAVRFIKERRGEDVDLESIDYDRKEVFDLISSGDTEGVFLLDGGAMQEFARNLKPDSLEEITAAIVLYRPGVMEQIPRYINGKNNPDTIVYQHPLLKQTLDVTRGCVIYQEQIMEIAKNLAGYTLAKADIMRRALCAKNDERTEAERNRFIYGSGDTAGCVNNGIDAETAASVFDRIRDCAGRAFNKSHAAAYAVMAYRMAYLKTFYAAEYDEAIKSIGKEMNAYE